MNTRKLLRSQYEYILEGFLTYKFFKNGFPPKHVLKISFLLSHRTSTQDYINNFPCSLVIFNFHSYLSLGRQLHQIDASDPEFVVSFEASTFGCPAKNLLGLCPA